MNETDNFDCYFFTWQWFWNHNFIITSWCSFNCFKVTFLTFWLELNFKFFLKIHVFINENLSLLFIHTLSCRQCQLIKVFIPTFWRVLTTNRICIRMPKSLYFFILKLAIRMVKRLHLRRISRWCWISIVFELPVIPTCQMRFSHVHDIFYFTHVICGICDTSKFSHWKSNMKLFCIFMSDFCVLLINQLAFVWSIWVSKWAVSMIAYYVKSFERLLTWRVIKSSQNISNWRLKKEKLCLVNLSDGFGDFLIKRK